MNTIDYSKPEPRDDQEAFDIVVRHLLTQGRRSVLVGFRGERGAYRGAEGMKCAIGALIPDRLYRKEYDPPEMESIVPSGDLYCVPELVPYLPRNSEVARALQCVHDYGEPSTWRDRLRYVAETFGLDASIVDRVAAATRAAETDGEGEQGGRS